MIKLIASDLDGTIIDYNNQVANDNMTAINKLHDTSINFAICTGKTYSMTKNICNELHPTYGIFGNGTQIINLKTGEEIIRNVIANEQAINCLQIAEDKNLNVHIYTENKIIAQQELRYIGFRNYILYKNQVDFEIVESLEKYIKQNVPSILKLVISGNTDLEKMKKQIEDKENLTAIQIKKYDKYKDKTINEEYEYLDIVPKNVTKYTALKQLSDYLKVTNDEILAVGDNVNDIEMIKNAGIGVAIGGCYDEVKEIASYVTKNTVKTGGFAEAVYRFIEF